jgi:hypothetical protein
MGFDGMVKLINPTFKGPQKTNSIAFKQLNTSDYEIGKIQQNVMESFSKITETFDRLNDSICIYEQNFSTTINPSSFFGLSSQVSDSFGVYSDNIFKAPKESKYFFNLFLYITVAANKNHSILVYKNGIDSLRPWYGENTTTHIHPNATFTLNLKAGDEIKLFWSSTDASPVSFGNSSLIENQFIVRW